MVLYKKGELKLDEMIIWEYKLEDLSLVFDDMFKGCNVKGVVVFE